MRLPRILARDEAPRAVGHQADLTIDVASVRVEAGPLKDRVVGDGGRRPIRPFFEIEEELIREMIENGEISESDLV